MDKPGGINDMVRLPPGVELAIKKGFRKKMMVSEVAFDALAVNRQTTRCAVLTQTSLPSFY